MGEAEFPIQVDQPPRDGITNMHYHPTDPNLLIVSSWDQTLRVYDTATGNAKDTCTFNSPVMDCGFMDKYHVVTGGLDGSVNVVDMNNKKQTTLGSHKEGTRNVCWDAAHGCVYSGSWDKTLQLWDVRSASNTTVELGAKVFSMDLKGHLLGLALSDRHACIYDTRKMDKPWLSTKTSLRHMLKCIRFMPDGSGYASSSIEGRVYLEWFGQPENETKHISFKLHRYNLDETEVVYPVNALAFHPTYNTFASGGSDGAVFTWDTSSYKRIRQYVRFNEEVAHLDVNADGSQLAVACSYTFDEGERPHAPDAIYIRNLSPTDFAPRQS
ncbi:WD40 repeat-like protein [Hesseltinella vesiculosa]|uniref:WD40 repeat-like protein n=1 Tax=Hesseltinella vesiculosa TaxID=101127 RepID=A0A1X2G225_9FUNG|nr:WD40 repeat-like protein [Hesseltinella vesiculosa]